MVHYLFYIRLFVFEIGGNFSNCSLSCSGTLISHCKNQTLRLTSSCPVTGPGAMDACMARILSSIALTTTQFSRMSTIDIPTSGRHCSFYFRYTASALLTIPSLFPVECLLQ